MPVTRRAVGILVKAGPGFGDAPLALGGAPLAVRPLFTSIGGTDGMAAAGGSRWYVATAPAGAAADNAWDLCHALVRGDRGFAGARPPLFAEPDLEQQWISGRVAEQAAALAKGCDRPAPQDARFPRDANDLWFQDAEHAQLAAARDAAGAGRGARVRVAHLDTGYDPRHAALPQHLDLDRQRSFVDGDAPHDATDRTDGVLTNLGHGTGTLGILAGRPVGGLAVGAAPSVEVVPIRVADRVVLFSNSAIARALDYVHALCGSADSRIDVVTMSMGGLASQAWAEAVNALYEAGVFVVTAAGNNFGNLPTRHVVFPARFGRVVAACGIMADQTPYTDLGFERMAGNYGPADAMATAVAAYTPNTPWARLGCPEIVDRDGAGTSAATPQVAAAAALWIQKNREALARYAEPWMRVEAIRAALFGSALLSPIGAGARLGHGALRALAMIGERPAPAAGLARTPEDDARFSFFRVLTGLGVQGSDAEARMLELECLQLSQSAEIEAVLAEIGAPADASHRDVDRLAEALASRPEASSRLRAALGGRVVRPPRTAMPLPETESAVTRLHLEHALDPPPPRPVSRRLRVYAYDPTLELRLETLGINEATLDVRWEDGLAPGPVGEYVEVVDVDPASRACYAPVDLDHPYLLVQEGLRPSEASPQFHQQMTYAVAMKTIQFFEEALGRVALWAPRRIRSEGGAPSEAYVQRLRIYPHALRAGNAYYSPDRVALLFGYFVASGTGTGDVLPGGVVFTAVSHDIVAHETTHALLDGLHRRYREPTNIDVLAFHEAFADIVALFQHFAMPEALRDQIARTRGDLRRRSPLGELAVQFGLATGGYGALRSYIGSVDEQGNWTPHEPKGDEYRQATEAHDRGAVLVAAVFEAFIRIYETRADQLVRLATDGTGVLPDGELSAPLAEALAREASKVARQVLAICIRALDYCPPIDITFGEYLRALITADRDLVPDDKRAYRVAFVSAFRDRGIYPTDVRHLSVDSLAWEPPPLPLTGIADVVDRMSLSWNLKSDRKAAYDASRRNAAMLHRWLTDANAPGERTDALGLARDPRSVTEVGGHAGTLGGIEVHSVRPARRIGPDGQSRADLVVEITQTFRLAEPGRHRLRGGCTLLVDLETKEVRYFVRKRVASPERLDRQLALRASGDAGLRGTYLDDALNDREPFAMLHRHA